uniref:Uncharacterized protein n=1 Tax=Arundo donax TaxID=35708 RepID=A0A0A9ATN2_ARUDO
MVAALLLLAVLAGSECLLGSMEVRVPAAWWTPLAHVQGSRLWDPGHGSLGRKLSKKLAMFVHSDFFMISPLWRLRSRTSPLCNLPTTADGCIHEIHGGDCFFPYSGGRATKTASSRQGWMDALVLLTGYQ